MATSTVHFAPCHQEEAGMLSLGDDAIVSELKAAGASLVLALAAAQNGDWAAAEGLALQTPVIVKYRDEKTDLATALEQWLR